MNTKNKNYNLLWLINNKNDVNSNLINPYKIDVTQSNTMPSIKK
jgi:hypothetical protein